MNAHDIADTCAEQHETEGEAGTPAGGGRGYQTRPFLRIRRGYTDLPRDEDRNRRC